MFVHKMIDFGQQPYCVGGTVVSFRRQFLRIYLHPRSSGDVFLLIVVLLEYLVTQNLQKIYCEVYIVMLQ